MMRAGFFLRSCVFPLFEVAVDPAFGRERWE